MKLMACHTVCVGKWEREPGTRGTDDPGVKECRDFKQFEVFESLDWMDDEEAQRLIDQNAVIPAPKDGEPVNMPGMATPNPRKVHQSAQPQQTNPYL
jgi:hypothetical protein